MSDEYVECPSCNSVVPIGRFCKSCGARLIVAPPAELPGETSHEPSAPLIPEEDMPDNLPEFGITVPEMERLAFTRIMSKAELSVIQKDLDLLIKQIQSTRQALQLQQSDKALLTARAEQLRAAFDRTKARREELSSGTGKLPLEKVHTSFKEHEEKLAKLDAAEDSLDSAVYKEQREKLIATLKALKKELKNSIKAAEKWHKNMKKARRTIEKDSSRLDAKYKMGDMSASTYDEAKARIERSLMVLELAREMLGEIIENAKKM
jgi:DNA repair exonuclease SbcCD ATPase subunit